MRRTMIVAISALAAASAPQIASAEPEAMPRIEQRSGAERAGGLVFGLGVDATSAIGGAESVDGLVGPALWVGYDFGPWRPFGALRGGFGEMGRAQTWSRAMFGLGLDYGLYLGEHVRPSARVEIGAVHDDLMYGFMDDSDADSLRASLLEPYARAELALEATLDPILLLGSTRLGDGVYAVFGLAAHGGLGWRRAGEFSAWAPFAELPPGWESTGSAPGSPKPLMWNFGFDLIARWDFR